MQLLKSDAACPPNAFWASNPYSCRVVYSLVFTASENTHKAVEVLIHSFSFTRLAATQGKRV